MTKPIVDFLIIGAQKAGTSTLFELIKNHPQIAAPSIKEPGFFLARPYRKDPIDTIEKYHALFDKKEGQLAFEATVDYSSYPHLIDACWKEIYAYNPKMKIIYILRDPVKRIISAHNFLYKLGVLNSANINHELQRSSAHIDFSKYHSQIQPYIEQFGKSQVMILFLEDLNKNPQALCSDLFRFLGLEDFTLMKNLGTSFNSRKSLQLKKGTFADKIVRTSLLKKLKRTWVLRKIRDVVKPMVERKLNEQNLKLDHTSIQKLRTILLPEIEGIESLTGRDLNHWKNSLQL